MLRDKRERNHIKCSIRTKESIKTEKVQKGKKEKKITIISYKYDRYEFYYISNGLHVNEQNIPIKMQCQIEYKSIRPKVFW